jgi:hypothetical protein
MPLDTPLMAPWRRLIHARIGHPAGETLSAACLTCGSHARPDDLARIWYRIRYAKSVDLGRLHPYSRSMTTSARDSAFFHKSAGVRSSSHLTNRNQPSTDSRGESAQRSKVHLRAVPIERPRADDDAPAPVRSNGVVLAFARLVREALEAEDQASDKGA